MKPHFMAIFVMALAPTFASADATITFSPGPDFTTRVGTPWGQYIVDDEGSTIWVGTEAEYVNRKVLGISAAQGYREMRIQGEPPNEHRMVSAYRPAVSVGSIRLADIQSYICFECGPDLKASRPAKPKDSQYVAILWTQSKRQNMRVTILDRDGKIPYQPLICAPLKGDPNEQDCEFILPNAVVTKPVTAIFTTDASTPAALPVVSVAQLMYQDRLRSNAELAKMERRPIQTPDEDRDRLRQLHQLDPSIPLAYP